MKNNNKNYYDNTRPSYFTYDNELKPNLPEGVGVSDDDKLTLKMKYNEEQLEIIDRLETFLEDF